MRRRKARSLCYAFAGCPTTRTAVSVGIALLARSALQLRACTSTRSPFASFERSATAFIPLPRTFVCGVSVTDAVPAVFHAFPQWFAPTTVMLSDVVPALVNVPLKSTVTIGVQPAPVVGGLPLSVGGAATAVETLSKTLRTFFRF